MVRPARYIMGAFHPTLRAAPGACMRLPLFRTPCDVASRRNPVALATALLQPNSPTAIIIDEPELRLHSAAIEILANLIEVAPYLGRKGVFVQSSETTTASGKVVGEVNTEGMNVPHGKAGTKI